MGFAAVGEEGDAQRAVVVGGGHVMSLLLAGLIGTGQRGLIRQAGWSGRSCGGWSDTPGRACGPQVSDSLTGGSNAAPSA
jgi:hypothetical protein